MQVRLAMGLDPFVESAGANSPLNAANHNHILSNPVAAAAAPFFLQRTYFSFHLYVL